MPYCKRGTRKNKQGDCVPYVKKLGLQSQTIFSRIGKLNNNSTKRKHAKPRMSKIDNIFVQLPSTKRGSLLLSITYEDGSIILITKKGETIAGKINAERRLHKTLASLNRALVEKKLTPIDGHHFAEKFGDNPTIIDTTRHANKNYENIDVSELLNPIALHPEWNLWKDETQM